MSDLRALYRVTALKKSSNLKAINILITRILILFHIYAGGLMVIGAKSQFNMPGSISTRLHCVIGKGMDLFFSIYELNSRADRTRWKIMNPKLAKKWGIDSVKISCPRQTTTTIAAVHVMSL